MKKNLIIGLLTIVSLVSLTYGYFQKERADEQEALAIEQSKIAREAVIKAEQSQKEAQMQRQIAEINAFRAMAQLEMTLKAADEAKKKN
jgi:Tfp pilus assembly protein PilO